MPTTLFVLVNAIINAFRMVDHVFVLTRGGPDNASTLLLYHLYEVGFKLLRTPATPRRSRSCWCSRWLQCRCSSSSSSIAGCTTGERFGAGDEFRSPTQTRRPPAHSPGRTPRGSMSWRPGCCALLWVLPLAYAAWTAFHPAEYSARFASSAPLTLDNFRQAWDAAPFARYFLNTTLLRRA
jgi:hypothetical protein